MYMIKLTDLIFMYDNLLTKNECDFITADFDKNSIYKEHCFESNSTELRESTVDIISLVPNTEVFDLVADKIDKLIREYAKYLEKLDFMWVDGMMCNLAYTHNYRLMKYSVGQSIHTHVDKSRDTYGSHTLGLSDNYKGGEMSFLKVNINTLPFKDRE